MWKKLLVLAGIGVAVALVARKIKANSDASNDQELFPHVSHLSASGARKNRTFDLRVISSAL